MQSAAYMAVKTGKRGTIDIDIISIRWAAG